MVRQLLGLLGAAVEASPAGQPGERSFEDDAAEQLSPASADLLLNPAWTSAAIGEHKRAPYIAWTASAGW